MPRQYIRRTPRTPLIPIEDRFWEKVDTSGDCWVWTAGKTRDGYGQFQIGRSPRRAHRIVWEWEHGAIPDGMEVCHSCDNPACVNVAHLWLGTHHDNMIDRQRKGRYSVLPRGERHYMAKLSRQVVREMRMFYYMGWSPREFCADYNVSASVAYAAVSGKTWKSVPDEFDQMQWLL